MKSLIVSPHYDDAVFSLGGSLENQFINHVEICSVFTITNWTTRGSGNKKYISELRKNEDIRLSIALGINRRNLDYPDACVRPLYGRNYFNKDLNPREDYLFTRIKSDLKRLICNNNYTHIYFPLGLGLHIDHRLLFEIGYDLLVNGSPIIFFEDVPYNMCVDDTAINNYLKNIPTNLFPHTFRLIKINKKIKLCKYYKSQIDKEVVDKIILISEIRGGERVWTSEDIATSL